MLIYFSLAVWVSLALTQAPLDTMRQDLEQPDKQTV
jgi:hypothetical protein